MYVFCHESYVSLFYCIEMLSSNMIFFQETELFQFVTPFKNLVIDFGKDDCIKDFFTFF